MNSLILEENENGQFPIDVFAKLAESRIIFLTGEIDDNNAVDICATLMTKDAENKDSKITIFLNSEGGDIRNVLMLCDVMNMISSPVEVICIGAAIDEAALILVSGEKGHRMATKNSTICVSPLIHDYINMHSNLTDAKTALSCSIEDNKNIMSILAKSSGKTLKQVTSDFNRKTYMTAAQAVKYGLIDKVVKVKK